MRAEPFNFTDIVNTSEQRNDRTGFIEIEQRIDKLIFNNHRDCSWLVKRTRETIVLSLRDRIFKAIDDGRQYVVRYYKVIEKDDPNHSCIRCVGRALVTLYYIDDAEVGEYIIGDAYPVPDGNRTTFKLVTQKEKINTKISAYDRTSILEQRQFNIVKTVGLGETTRVLQRIS